MSNVKEIIADYKKALEEQEKAEKDKLERKKQRRIDTGAMIAEHIRNEIQPVFERAVNDLREAGFDCEVQKISKKDPFFVASQETPIEIRLLLKIGRCGFVEESFLHYKGSFDEQSMASSYYIQRHQKPSVDKPPEPLIQLVSEKIEKYVEAFLKRFFSFD